MQYNLFNNKVFYYNQADFIPPSENGSRISAGAVVAIVAGVVVFLVLVFGILRWRGFLGQKSSLAKGNLHITCSVTMIGFVLQLKDF